MYFRTEFTPFRYYLGLGINPEDKIVWACIIVWTFIFSWGEPEL